MDEEISHQNIFDKKWLSAFMKGVCRQVEENRQDV